MKRETQKLESENIRLQRRIEQLLRLSEGGRTVSIPADVRRDIEKGILVRQLKTHINTLRDLLSEKEQEIDTIKRDLKFNNLFELQREKDEYLRETQRLQTLIRDMKAELQKEKQRREWNNKLFGANGGDELKKEVARLASGYQNILSNISFRHGSQLATPVSTFFPSTEVNTPKRPQSASAASSNSNAAALFHKAPALDFRSPVFDDPIDNFGTKILPYKTTVAEKTTYDLSPTIANGRSESKDSLTDISKGNSGSSISKHITVSSMLYGIGDRVEGKFRDGMEWYSAVVKSVNISDGTYHLVYDDGDEEKVVPLSRIRKPMVLESLSPKTSPSAPEKPQSTAQQQSPKVRQDRIQQIQQPPQVPQPAPAKSPPPSPVKEKIQAKFKVGDKVNALYYNGSTAYPATVTAIVAVEDSFFYDLLYDDGDREKKVAEPKVTLRTAEAQPAKDLPSLNLSKADLTKTSAPPEEPKKKVAKYTKGSKVEGLFDGGPTWYSATVQAVHPSADGTSFSYDLLYDDGDTEEGVIEDEVRAVGIDGSNKSASTAIAQDGLDKAAAKTFLTAHDWPKGLQESFLENLENIAVRYFICDDSSSMNTEDGTKLLKVGKKYTTMACSRWTEIGEVLKFHINLSRQAAARSEFRFCNSDRTIVIGAHKGRSDLKKLEEEGYHSLIKRLDGHADGTTPLCKHVNEVIEDIKAQEKQLRKDGKRAVVIITSDGESTDGDVMRALQPLSHLPASLVIRLCTDDEKVTEYWGGLLSFSFPYDILDDQIRQAEEVYRVNPWLTYAEPLHRVLEFGVPHDVIDHLNTSLLSYHQLRSISHMIYGGPEMPDPEKDWTAFVNRVNEENRKVPLVWNPVSQHPTDWIDVTALESCYSNKERVLGSRNSRIEKKTFAKEDSVPVETKLEPSAANEDILSARSGSGLSGNGSGNGNNGIEGKNSKNNESFGSAIKSTNLDNFLDQLSDDEEEGDNGDTFGAVGLGLDGGRMVTLKMGEEAAISQEDSDHDLAAKKSLIYEEDFD